jgi:hypothetical protein
LVFQVSPLEEASPGHYEQIAPDEVALQARRQNTQMKNILTAIEASI